MHLLNKEEKNRCDYLDRQRIKLRTIESEIRGKDIGKKKDHDFFITLVLLDYF